MTVPIGWCAIDIGGSFTQKKKERKKRLTKRCFGNMNGLPRSLKTKMKFKDKDALMRGSETVGAFFSCFCLFAF